MCSSSPPIATATTAADKGGATEFSALHPDIVESHVLTRLDGPTLASAASCSTVLRRLSSPELFWSNICHSTWPSTNSPRVVSSFPDGGPRAFFSQAFPLPDPSNLSRSWWDLPSELISAVDIHYKDQLIFTKVHETESYTGWFRCSPFRIDLLEPKDVVPTPIKNPNDNDDACSELIRDMTLTWILIDPFQRRAVNLSSHKAVTVQRHWLTGEIQLRFASILEGRVQCGIVVTCGRSEHGVMLVKEVSLEMEDVDGTHLSGRDGLVILEGALRGKKGNGRNRVVEARRRYEEFLDKKRERRERKLRIEGALDVLCAIFGVLLFFAFWCFIFYMRR